MEKIKTSKRKKDHINRRPSSKEACEERAVWSYSLTYSHSRSTWLHGVEPSLIVVYPSKNGVSTQGNSMLVI